MPVCRVARARNLAVGVTQFLLSTAGYAEALRSDAEWVVATNLYNVHYHYDSAHLRYSPLIGVERRRDDGWLYGGTLFRNSFGQFCQLVYGGYLWNLGDTGIYGKLIGGVMHGYRGEYRNKVPLNYGGFSPGVLPSLGYRYGPVRIETQFFWTNGLMITGGWAFR
ncbi:sn-glycerol-3-phosphate transporter [Pararobbsia silviterrae]|uniref:sn-glycerol-3-phosphate transporter n=2 Tax=Pararobbsia silviterrae TaxID=1792498 RepID=A0A494XG64_9BURK|nr:sn-glycerol-3-phosphate transporter [Pararobbsia silviterrae]